MIRAVLIDPGLHRFELGTQLSLTLIGACQRAADIVGFPFELFKRRAILTPGFLEACFEPSGGVVQTVAIEAECCYLFDCQITLLL
jgi:hypothetical protein